MADANSNILDAIAADPNVSEAFKDGMKAGEAKHTPGPWLINPAADAKHEIIADDEPMVICRTSNVLYQKEATANAYLIAAAPQLLECLKTARNQLKTLGTPDDGINNFIIAAIDAAVAKATGAQE